MSIVSKRATTRGESSVTVPMRYGRLRRREMVFAGLMILPTAVAVLAVTAYPFFYSAWLSVNTMNQFTKRWTFVGLGNYAEIWGSGDLRAAFFRTVLFCVVTVIGGTL